MVIPRIGAHVRRPGKGRILAGPPTMEERSVPSGTGRERALTFRLPADMARRLRAGAPEAAHHNNVLALNECLDYRPFPH